MIRNKQHVYYILEDYPETRNSDWLLLDRYIERFFNGNREIAKRYLSLAAITRARRHIQNTQKEFLSSKQVQEARERKEIEYRNFYRTKT